MNTALGAFALLLVFVAALAAVVGGFRLWRARRLEREMADEERLFRAYIDELGWNQTGEVVE